MFELDGNLSEQRIIEAARSLGLDIEMFREEWENQEQLERFHRNFWSGIRSSVNDTPTIVLTGIDAMVHSISMRLFHNF